MSIILTDHEPTPSPLTDALTRLAWTTALIVIAFFGFLAMNDLTDKPVEQQVNREAR